MLDRMKQKVQLLRIVQLYETAVKGDSEGSSQLPTQQLLPG